MTPGALRYFATIEKSDGTCLSRETADRDVLVHWINTHLDVAHDARLTINLEATDLAALAMHAVWAGVTPDDLARIERGDVVSATKADEWQVRPADVIRWVLWRRLREPGFMPKFPFTLTDLADIDPTSAASIDMAFGYQPGGPLLPPTGGEH